MTPCAVSFTFDALPGAVAVVPVPAGFWIGGQVPVPADPICNVTVGDACKALIAAKTAAGFRPKYIKSLRQALALFWRGREKDRIAEATLESLEQRMDEVGGRAASSKAAFIGRLSALFSFAVRRGWVRENPCRRLEKPRIALGPPSVITAEQTRAMLDAAPAEIRAYLVLCVFCGLRPSEAEAMDWSGIRLGQRKVVVDAAASKTARRRVVPIGDAAAAWLALDAKQSGPVVTSHSTMRRRRRELCRGLGWHLGQDVLRHTYASMSVAAGVNLGELADRMGNSRAIIGRNYKELIGEDEATAFWAIRPHNGGAM